MADVIPQFRIVLPNEAISYRTKVFVNDIELRNVGLVEVTNRAAVDDLVTSRITIELASEAIMVERDGGVQNSRPDPADTGATHENITK